jgi:hypothetical protein
MTFFQRLYLVTLISVAMSACSVEVKPLDGKKGNESAKETSASENSPEQNSGEETTSTENPPSEETNKEKCASGSLIDDIECDVDKMEM